MNSVVEKINVIVKEYTHFPGPIIQSQAKRLGLVVEDIKPADLPKLADAIGIAIANFSNPAKGEEVKKRLLSIK